MKFEMKLMKFLSSILMKCFFCKCINKVAIYVTIRLVDLAKTKTYKGPSRKKTTF